MVRLKFFTDSVSPTVSRFIATGELVGHGNERGLVEVGDEEQQEILVPELPQQAGDRAREEGVAMSPDDRERQTRDDEPRVTRESLAGAAPEPVVTIVALEVRERRRGIRQRIRLAGRVTMPMRTKSARVSSEGSSTAKNDMNGMRLYSSSR